MSAKLTIRNWDKWQSYRKDRGQPPWIKIHRCVMRNPEWVSLTDAERGQLVSIWLLAADHDGVIPASPEIIAKLCFMDGIPNLNKFAELGFIESNGCQCDATMTPPRRQDDPPETETEKNREEKNPPYSPPQGDSYTPAFNSFWSKYPKKVGKDAAWRAWKKIKRPSETLTVILEALEWQVVSEDWTKENGKYIPNPSTYLNQGRWKDEKPIGGGTGSDPYAWQRPTR